MKAIYLKIDYKDTKKLMGQQIIKYNTNLESEFLKDPEAFRTKYALTPSEKTFRSRTIKSGTQDVAFAILDMYAKFLLNNEKKGLKNPVFKVNRKGVCTKLNGLLSKTSVWRHIGRATDAGIFDKTGYVYHGQNSSFELKFNPAILVACHNEMYFEMAVKNCQQLVNNIELSVEKLEELQHTRPPFSQTFNGYMLPNWNDTVSGKPSLDRNINMDKAFLVENLPLSLQDSTKKDFPETDASVSSLDRSLEHENIKGVGKNTFPLPASKSDRAKTLEQKFRAKNSEIVPQNVDNDLLFVNIKSALSLILSVLYKGIHIPEVHLSLAKEFLSGYFNPRSKDLKMSELYENLMLVVFEAHKAKTRRGFTPAPIWRWLDPNFSAGFYNSLKHVEKVVKPYMRTNEDHSKSVKELINIFKIHKKNPDDYENYRKASQLLGKKKNKAYLEFYNTCVEDPMQLNNQSLQTLWSKTVITNNQQAN
ncbi:MAG TPA: hypothetical protein VGC65_00290 [Bacteroidia bacterium]|jgi:hypothetical protein